jgi:hypothetical protein
MIDVLSWFRKPQIEVGDLVQWDQNGTLQLAEPTQVRFISECRQWVIVQGSNTGLPMGEMVLVSKQRRAKNPPHRGSR